MPLKNSVGSQPSTATARYLSLRCIFSYPLRFFLLSLSLSLLSHLSFAVIIIIIAIRFFFHEKNFLHAFRIKILLRPKITG